MNAKKSTVRPSVNGKTLLRGCLLALLGCLLFLSVALLLFSVTGQSGRLYDFCQEWTSVQSYFAGYPIYMDYGQSIELHLGVEANTPFLYNAHPPGSVLLVLPVCVFDYGTAYLLWAAVSMAALIAALFIIYRQQSLGLGALGILTFLILLFAGNALRHHMVQGQLNLLLLLLIVCAWSASRNGRDGLSGVLLGLAAAVKLFPAFLGLYFLATRKWRGVWTMALSFLIVNACAVFVFGFDTYVAYFSDVMPSVSRYRDTWQNASVWGLWCRLFDGGFGQVIPLWKSPALASFLSVVSCLVLTVVTGVSIWRLPKKGGEDAALGLCVTAMLLVSPITWDHYFVLLILPMAIFWAIPGSYPTTRLAIVASVVLLLFVNPAWVWQVFISGFPETRPDPVPANPAEVLIAVSYPFYVLLGAYVAMLRQFRISFASQDEAG